MSGSFLWITAEYSFRVNQRHNVTETLTSTEVFFKRFFFVAQQMKHNYSDNSDASYQTESAPCDSCDRSQSCSDSRSESRPCDSCNSPKSSPCDKKPVRCEEKCDPKAILRKCADAVVEVHAEFILLGTGFTGTVDPSGNVILNGATPLAPNTRADILLEGNGFFIKGHRICVPANLVIAPPSISSVASRYPVFDPATFAITGTIKNQMVQASRILVSVFNVNGNGKSYIYEARLMGVDGLGDVAVLEIDYCKRFNKCNPVIDCKCHPFLRFERKCCDGERIFLIGDYVSNALDRRRFNAVGAICDGLVSDCKYFGYEGFLLAESVLVSAPAYAFSSGLPIINCDGKVIAMQTTDLAAVYPGGIPNFFPGAQGEGTGLVAGPSARHIVCVAREIIRGTSSRCANQRLERICDPIGAYVRYRRGYAGIGYEVFTGVDYDLTVDYNSASIVAGLPRVRLGPNGQFVDLPSCKQIRGIRVIGLAGLNPNDSGLGDANVVDGAYFVPGGIVTDNTVLTNGLPISPFLSKLQPGDVITSIDGRPVGDLDCQTVPSTIIWDKLAGDTIQIAFIRGGNADNFSNNVATANYEDGGCVNDCLVDYPAALDYPWYAIQRFPLLSTTPYPGFVFPAEQLVNPQVPAIQGGARFQPAI